MRTTGLLANGIRLAAGMALLAQPTDSALIYVDSTCTLPAAIQTANLDSPSGACEVGSGSDTVVLTESVQLLSGPYDADGPTGLPSITSKVTLDGKGHSIWQDRTTEFRIAHVGAGGDLTLRDVTIAMGKAQKGGGLYVRGRLTLSNSTVSGNLAKESGGGIYLHAGSEAQVESSMIDINYIQDAYHYRQTGGGIHAGENSLLSVVDSTISGNIIQGTGIALGGGVYAGTADLTIVSSTLSGNHAVGGPDGSFFARGGAVYGHGVAITNSTISGNVTGGVFTYGGGVAGSGRVRHVTFRANSAEYGAAVWGFDPNPADSEIVEIKLSGSLLAARVAGNHCSGSVADEGYNLADDLTCLPTIAGTLSNLNATLADNGGPTKTHALDADSLAIDLAGNCGLGTGQRGAARVGGCDAGAYEKVPCLGEIEETTISTLHDPYADTPCHSVIVGPGLDIAGPDGYLIVNAGHLVILRNGVAVGGDGELLIGFGM